MNFSMMSFNIVLKILSLVLIFCILFSFNAHVDEIKRVEKVLKS